MTAHFGVLAEPMVWLVASARKRMQGIGSVVAARPLLSSAAVVV